VTGSVPPLRWIRPPQQERSQKTLVRLLDAAEALIAEKGFTDTGVAEVARRAGSSVGAFYARFRDKDALLHAVYDRYMAQAVATADDALDPARWDGIDLPTLVGSVVGFLVEIYRERAGLMRAFVVRNHTDPDFRDREGRLSHYVDEKLAALLLARRTEIRHPDPERAASFGLGMVVGTIEAAVLFGEMRSSIHSYNDTTLTAELTRAFLAYLGAPIAT
jgi:AcrR family transcriptional regulator